MDDPDIAGEQERNAKMLMALNHLTAIAATTDTRIAGWVTDIRVGIRDLNTYVAQAREEIAALKEKPKPDLPEGLHAIVRRGNAWDAGYDLIIWNTEEWEVVQTDLTRANAIVLRDHYNAGITP
jgi:hypothetical protein